MGFGAKLVGEFTKKLEHTPGLGYVILLASALLATILGKTDEDWSLLFWANVVSLLAYWFGGFLDDILFDPVFGAPPEAPPASKSGNRAGRFIANAIRSVAHRAPLVKSVDNRRSAAAQRFHPRKKDGIYTTAKKFFEATEAWEGPVKLFLDLSKLARTLVLPSVVLVAWDGLASRDIVSLPGFLEAGKPLGWLRVPVAPTIIAIVTLLLYVWLRLLHMNLLYGLVDKSNIFKFSVPVTPGKQEVIWSVGERLIPASEVPILKATITADEELRKICRDLLAKGWSESEWAEREADDGVQSSQYKGGYDATEGAFCFSRATEDAELWFQFTLAEAGAIADGALTKLSARLTD